MTGCSFAVSKATRRPRAASSFQILPRRSLKKAKSSPLAPEEDGERIPMDVKAGDRILFGKWSGSEIKLDGEDLLIMKESDILGVIA